MQRLEKTKNRSARAAAEVKYAAGEVACAAGEAKSTVTRETTGSAAADVTENTPRRALLVVSFGTTHEETRRLTIDAIESHLAEAFPDRKLYRGWTSRMIVKRLRERGEQVDTLEEALERMREDGMTDILVQPTHMIPGAENDRMAAALDAAAGIASKAKEETNPDGVSGGISDKAPGEPSGGFERIAAGQPLLSSQEDMEQLARMLAEELLGASGDEKSVLVLMGHGSAKKPEANRIYAEMEQAFRRIGRDDVFVATVEGTPTLEDVMTALEAGKKSATAQNYAAASGADKASAVILAPLMIVAGDHAKNDMAGPEEDSWKSRFEAAGYQVKAVLRGLGEYPAVQEMLAEHARRAETILG